MPTPVRRTRPRIAVAYSGIEQGPCPWRNVMAVVRPPDIEQIFTVIDRLGISREAVVIPLTKRDPGDVRLLPDGRLEMVVPESTTVEAWLPDLETRIRALMERDAGS